MVNEVGLGVAPGDGVLARFGDEMVFLPDGEPTLLAVFTDAVEGERLDAVTDALDAAPADDAGEPGQPRVIAVSWAGSIRVVVSGAVEVESDHRSLPRLSAAGAGTWVERTVRDAAGPVRIVSAGVVAAPSSDLARGVVPAGGFELLLAARTDAPPVVDASPVARAVVTVASASQPAPRDEPQAVSAASTDEETDPVPSPPLSELPETNELSWSSRADEHVQPTAIPLPDLPGSVSDPAVGGRSADTEPGGTPAPVLEAGTPVHRPALTPADLFAAPSTVEQSSVNEATWSLEFADGSVESVGVTLVIGRRPDESVVRPGARLLSLSCPQLSRNHLEVRAEAEHVVLTDLGSSNGSFMLTTGDGRLVRLEPNTPHRAGAGTAVQIGSQRFIVRHARA